MSWQEPWWRDRGTGPGRADCDYCTDENGQLQSFDERFDRMTSWQARRNPGATRQEIERQTLDYMATMPAWQDHPRVAASRSPES
ncbi:MAG: hypothetical protein ACRDOU_10765 [Streptosporangiaceae bacterium]